MECSNGVVSLYHQPVFSSQDWPGRKSLIPCGRKKSLKMGLLVSKKVYHEGVPRLGVISGSQDH